MAPPWKERFDLGVAEFRKANYPVALAHFDYILGIVNDEHIVHDSRAATLEKLGRVSDALKDAKKVIDMCPDSYKGYCRAASLFQALGREDSAKKMIEMALARLPPDSPRQATVLEIQSKVEAAIAEKDRRRQCWIAMLPVEILSEVMALVVGAQPRDLIALIGTCKHWRHVAFGASHLWQSLTLGRSRPLTKLDEWTSRSSKNPTTRCVPSLKITDRVPSSQSIAALEKWYTTLRAVPACDHTPTSLTWKVEASPLSFCSFLSENGLPSTLRELSLDLGVYCSSNASSDAATAAITRALRSPFHPHNPDYSLDASNEENDSSDLSSSHNQGDWLCPSLESLTLVNAQSQYFLPAIPKRLRKLSLIRCQLSANPLLRDLLTVCEANATTVEMLEVEFQFHDSQGPDQGLLQLPALKCLQLSDTTAVVQFLRKIVAQNLEVLRIRRPLVTIATICRVMEELWCFDGAYKNPYPWISSPRSPSPPQPGGYTSPPPLRELRLIQCSVTEAFLIPVLASFPRLEVLQVTSSGFDANKVVHALAGINSAAIKGEGESTRRLLCPSLSKIDFSGCVQLKGGPVRDLVKSRLSPVTAKADVSDQTGDKASMLPQIRPLRSVIVNYCPKIEATLLPWFRSTVPVFSCIYQTRGEAAKEARRGR